ncbi:unnamed protein product [Allacma fusca]|uniref:Uncharacterized protein n=1 Tax=Allacma fusca TaxID=39272 RepID=A0A8J2PP55_9HEXA|nr:unnamed protein product [Allacma fusca]
MFEFIPKYAKEHHGCLIVDNFICASTSRTEKHLVTFRNECFFNSAVKVNEAVAMVYCGICDPNREFQKKGAKPDPKDFECLKFDRKGKNGQQ